MLEEFTACYYHAELKKALGLMSVLLCHTLHAGSIRSDRKGFKYDAPNKKPTYLKYSRTKEAARRFIQKHRKPAPTKGGGT